jgi:hypothetical protein
VAIELAVLRRGAAVAVAGGEDALVSFWDAPRDNHENGLVSLREAGAGGAAAKAALAPGFGLVLGGASVAPAGGDHGMAGREAAMLLSEIFLAGCFPGTGGGESVRICQS